jgi:hypothetical protein
VFNTPSTQFLLIAAWYLIGSLSEPPPFLVYKLLLYLSYVGVNPTLETVTLCSVYSISYVADLLLTHLSHYEYVNQVWARRKWQIKLGQWISTMEWTNEFWHKVIGHWGFWIWDCNYYRKTHTWSRGSFLECFYKMVGWKMSQVFEPVNLSEVWRCSQHATSIGTWIDWIRCCEKQHMRFSMKERTGTHPGSRISLSKAQESQHTVLTSNDDLLQNLLNIWTYQCY